MHRQPPASTRAKDRAGSRAPSSAQSRSFPASETRGTAARRHAVALRTCWPPLLLLRGRQIGADALEHFGRHPHAFAESRMRVNCLADVGGIAAHLDRKAHFADQVTGLRADDAAADAAMRGLVE